MKHYKFLEQVFVKVRHVSDVMGSIYWSDLHPETKAERMCTLQEIRQEIMGNEMVSGAINDALANKGKMRDWEIANLKCMGRACKYLSGAPLDLSKNLIKAKIRCRSTWLSFREGNVPAKNVMEPLASVIKLSSEAAAAKSTGLGVANGYDVMLGEYDADLNAKDIDKIFTDMGDFFRSFVGEVSEKQGKSKYAPRPVSEDRQLTFYDYLLTSISTDFSGEKGLWDMDFMRLSSFEGHVKVPCCYEEDYRLGLSAMLDSAGKLLYWLNLPEKWKYQPVGRYSGSIMYEAQGLLMSRHLLMEKEFISFMLPGMKKLFSIRGRSATAESIYRCLTEVQQDVLLEKSNEISSLAHSMLRYTLEKEMIDDNLQVNDLVDAWAQGIKHYFNVENAEDYSFLQDEYWVNGIFGYVPCMAIASIVAAQIFQVMKSKEGVMGGIESGDFSNMISWLSKNIYSHGAKYGSMALLKKIAGKGLDIDYYKKCLADRYLCV